MSNLVTRDKTIHRIKIGTTTTKYDDISMDELLLMSFTDSQILSAFEGRPDT